MNPDALASSDPRPEGYLATRAAVRVSRADARSAFWRMLGLLWPHRRALTWGLVLGLGVALTYSMSLGGLLPVLKVVVERESLSAYLTQKAAETTAWYGGVLGWVAGWLPAGNTPQDAFRTLLMLMGVLLVLNLVGNALRVASQYLVLYASHRAMMDLRRRMYRKALHAPLTAVTGDVSARVSQFMSDAREVFAGITTLFGKVAREPLKAACVLAIALWLDWRVTMAVLAIAPVGVGLLWYFGRRVRKATVRMLEGYGVMLGGLEETLQGLDVVKTHTREADERRRMWKTERRMLRQLLRLSWIESLISPLLEVIGIAIAAAGMVWLASRTFSGELDPSRFMTLVVLLTAMLDPVRKVASVYNAVQRAGAAAQRIFQFLDEPEERSPRRPKALPAGTARTVCFEHVTFQYFADQQPPALFDVSLRVVPGECIAIVGPNGSGKSTLMRLLPRLLEPQEGRVCVDGIDVRELGLRDLRRQIAVVSQRPAIFARSVSDNIAYGNPDATPGQVREAARRAFAAEFIERWRDGYETLLGQYGATISGGQRQRIAIARAFLRPASILVFDEATSEVDAESEQKIHAALAELRRGKTTFLIAHRHTVMDLADRIVVMDGGRIIDVGTHAELLARCPLYVALYRSPA
jgi:subfamily B ATP-binding cassette protein MsbA